MIHRPTAYHEKRPIRNLRKRHSKTKSKPDPRKITARLISERPGRIVISDETNPEMIVPENVSPDPPSCEKTKSGKEPSGRKKKSKSRSKTPKKPSVKSMINCIRKPHLDDFRKKKIRPKTKLKIRIELNESPGINSVVKKMERGITSIEATAEKIRCKSEAPSEATQ